MAQQNTNAFKKLMEISSGWAVDPYRCPECGFELECYDGDNLEAMEQDFDDFRETLSIDASLLDFRCNQCSERYFLVMLSVIQATDLSDAWVNKYFWQNALLYDCTRCRGKKDKFKKILKKPVEN